MAIDEETLANLENLSPEELLEVATNVTEEYNTLKSATTKGEQIKDQAISFYKNFDWDFEKLEALQTEHPDVAKVLLKKFYDGKTVEEIKTSKQEAISSKENEEMIKQVDNRYNHYLSQIPEDLQESFKEEYAELVWKRTMTPEKVDKYVSMVVKSIQPQLSNTVEQARLAAAGWSSLKGDANTKNTDDVDYSTKLLKEMWVF